MIEGFDTLNPFRNYAMADETMADTRQIFNYEIHQNDLYVRDPGVMAPLKAVDLIDTKRPKFPRGTLLFRHVRYIRPAELTSSKALTRPQTQAMLILSYCFTFLPARISSHL